MATDLNKVLRPRTWGEIVGQQDVKDIILAALAHGNFPKFSIFAGPTGVGKSCMAELTAKSLLCTGIDKPCGKCAQCSRSANPNIIKYNMASMLGKKDIVSVLDNIFKFESLGDITIYILEEVQVLKQKEEQTPFLEELTKIPDGVYIMMCTTKVSSLLPTLRNRAITFQLTIPSNEECADYISYVLEAINCKPMTKAARFSLATLSDNTPRVITKHIELLAVDGELKEESLSKFFKTVSKSDYIRVLNGILNPDTELKTFVTRLNQLSETIAYDNLLVGLKDFVLTVFIEVCVGVADPTISKSDRVQLKDVMALTGENNFIALVDRIGAIKYESLSDAQAALYELIKLKMFTQGLTLKKAFQTNSENVSLQHVVSNRQVTVLDAAAPRQLVDVTSQLSDDDISAILGTTALEVSIEDSDDDD